jgi:hypothetical protein
VSATDQQPPAVPPDIQAPKIETQLPDAPFDIHAPENDAKPLDAMSKEELIEKLLQFWDGTEDTMRQHLLIQKRDFIFNIAIGANPGEVLKKLRSQW